MSRSEIEDQIHMAASIAVQHSPSFLPSLEQLDVQQPAPSLLFFAVPHKDSNGNILRSSSPRASVPTPTLVHALGKALRGKPIDTKVAFFQTMEGHPGTRRDAGNIYERWLHPFFLSQRIVNCNWHASRKDSNSLSTTLETTSNLVRTQGALKSAAPPLYWIAPKVTFPGIDSALFTEHEIFAIQVTIASDHPSPQGGLDKLREILPGRLKNLKWRVLFVGMAETQITGVSSQWARRLTIGTETKRKDVPVGWCVVDPAIQGIEYNAGGIDEQKMMEVEKDSDAE